MGFIKKDAFRTMLLSYSGIVLGYVNKGVLFIIFLTTEQIGLINLVVSVGTLFAQIANLGSVYSMWKFFPFFKNKELKNHGFLAYILVYVTLGILITSVLTLVFRNDIGLLYHDRSPLFLQYFNWIFPIGIAYVFYLVLEVYLRSFYKNIISVVAYEIILRLLTMLMLLVFWIKWIDFSSFVICHSFLFFVPTLILVWYLNRMKEFNLSISKIRISKKFKRVIFQFSMYNYINTLGSVIVNSLDVLMIASIVGLKSTGVYATVMFLVSAIQVPYKSLLRISTPLVAEYWKSKELDKMSDLYKKVSSFALVIGLGSFVFLWLNIDFLFSFLKPEYKEGIWIFFFLMLGKLLDMFFGLNGAIFTTSKKYKYDLLFTLFLIGCVFSLNMIFIPKWGGVGAAISTSIALIIYNLGRVFLIWKMYKIHPFTKNQFVIIGLGFLAIFIGGFVDVMIFGSWAHLGVQCLVFFGVFVFPIYHFNLQPEIVGYIKDGVYFLSKSLKKNVNR